ncbi:MAG: intein-containing RctB family protein [Candidatus Caldarchaeum sp.]
MAPTLEKIGNNTWRIPQTYRKDMRVPVIVYASEKLLEKMKTDRTLEQAVNVSTLPGIVKQMTVLPDAHEGYGFPIGGVAAMDATEGVISPGGVGYDINCLPGGTPILTELGYTKPIEKFEGLERIVAIHDAKATDAGIDLIFKKEEKRLLKITTESGFTLKATADHPILTKKGMLEAHRLKVGDYVALHPFEGLPYETPAEITILDGKTLPNTVAAELRKRGLLPLTSRNPKLPYLIRLLGYFTGDGAFDGKSTVFYGSIEGLEYIRRDIEKIGYKPSKIYTRRRKTIIGGKTTEGQENSVRVNARSFTALLQYLGAPKGKKKDTEYLVPNWLFNLPKWMKRLYLAGLFGAELNKPQTINGYNFTIPQLTLTKTIELEENGRKFLNEIGMLLQEIGVETTGINTVIEGDSIRLRLLISEKPENLKTLWSRVGYEYNPARRRLALAAVVWISLKQKIVEERRKAQELAVILHSNGAQKQEIIEALKSEHINGRFIERSLYEGRKTGPRVPRSLPEFEKWVNEHMHGDIIWDRIEKIEEIEAEEEVYDFTVDHESHNFIANGFVVSNCGVRLMVTDLTIGEVRPRIVELVNTVFRNVPAGLGSRRRDFVVTHSDLDRVALEGARYVIEKYGLGWADDFRKMEEEGRYPSYKTGNIPDPDPSIVSREAKARGESQIGTLGSGNHFLEIQRVDKIYDPRAAKAMGITQEGQITVLIHCGSRGYGHQICSDFLRIMERAVAKYNLRLPDRELACTPASSPEATQYLKAFGCAVNFAFANRQAISHWVRQSFEQVFKRSADDMGMQIVYDVCHNIVKLEKHKVDGSDIDVFVHRKGATRSFPAGHPLIPQVYREIGQPVLIPGSMGTASWVLLGNEKAMTLSFGSTAHGAGREMSRSGAKRRYRGDQVLRELESRGIYVKGDSMETVVEEVDAAYKSVDEVVEVSHQVGIGTKVARLVPIGVVKG